MMTNKKKKNWLTIEKENGMGYKFRLILTEVNESHTKRIMCVNRNSLKTSLLLFENYNLEIL